MRELQILERFEMETLEALNRIRILNRIYFGGGTMLRLCHNLNRYSTDLDFWIKSTEDAKAIFKRIHAGVSESFVIRDAENKRSTILFEIQSPKSNRNLKIEICKERQDFRWERKIAFSRFSNRQVAVKGLTLEQMMANKTAAFLSRNLIRDCYDIEFLLSRGVALTSDAEDLGKMIRHIDQFDDGDFKVALGPLLEPKDRAVIVCNRFRFLREEIIRALHMHRMNGEGS